MGHSVERDFLKRPLIPVTPETKNAALVLQAIVWDSQEEY